MPATSNSQPDGPRDDYDVVVIGGAFCGAGFALLLRRRLPSCRVLVVERAERFQRRVGEATVEVSGFFLNRILRLSDHLAREHLPKHGLRFWMTDGHARSFEEMTEVGARGMPHVPSFQLDRSKLDEHLLALAGEEGCDVLRPARVLDVEHGWPASRVLVEDESGERWVRTRWVVDGSGRQAFLARRLRLLSRVEEHPTAAAWARWKGVVDLDGPAFAHRDGTGRLPDVLSMRRLATNHFCGYGWWCWVIPLSGGETSIGVVYHKGLFDLPGQGSREERYRAFVTSQDGLRELVAGATMDEDDFMTYAHLPYRSSRYADRGWALLGDAAAFLDPLYSPGLDHASISIYATMQLVSRDLSGGLDDAELAEHNLNFERSYGRWLEALYLGKYEILGDAELVACAYLFDTALYYLGVVTPIYKDGASLANPPFGIGKPQATLAYRVMRTFNRRLRRLARSRRHAGTYGRLNLGHGYRTTVFSLGPRAAVRPLLHSLAIWLRLEAGSLLDRLLQGPRDVSEPVPSTASPGATGG